MKTESTETQEKKSETLEEAVMVVLDEDFNKPTNSQFVDSPLHYLNRLKGFIYANVRYFRKLGVNVANTEDIIKKFDAAYEELKPRLEAMENVYGEVESLHGLNVSNGNFYYDPVN